MQNPLAEKIRENGEKLAEELYISLQYCIENDGNFVEHEAKNQLRTASLSSQLSLIPILRAWAECKIVENGNDNSCIDFHDEKKGMPWTPCGACGNRRDEIPKLTGMDIAIRVRNQALSDLLSFLETAEKEIKL